MSYGLQLFSASGALMLDISDRLTRVHSTYILTANGNTSTFYAVAGVVNDGSWAVTIGSLSGFATASIEYGGFRVMNKSGVNSTVKIMLIQI